MNATAKRLRFWAMRHPRPNSFRVTSGASDKPSIVELGPRVTWARVSETLDAMDAELIEALGPNGNVIRACKPQDLDDDGEETDDDDDAPKATTAAIVDAETARFQMFAQLLSKAYIDAQSQVGLRNGAVFDRMIDLFETLAQQSKDQAHAMDVQQKTINKLYEQQIKDAFRAAAAKPGGDDEPSLIDQLAETFMKHATGNGGAPEPDEPEIDDEPAPNGAVPTGKGPH